MPGIFYFYLLKTLFLIRHAKSDQSFFGNDFERPLNERGKKDAPEMAKKLLKKNISIDAFVSSPAARAKKTAEFFAKEYQVSNEDIVFISALYNASAEVFYEVIKLLPDEKNKVALFSHNPGITYFVNSLIKDVRIDNMPTCAVFAIEADCTNWNSFAKAAKKFLFFEWPKK